MPIRRLNLLALIVVLAFCVTIHSPPIHAQMATLSVEAGGSGGKQASEVPSNQALADMLEDPQSRKKLIEALRQNAEQSGEKAAEEPIAPLSVIESVANSTRAMAEEAVDQVVEAADIIIGLDLRRTPITQPVFGKTMQEFGAVVGLTLLIFLLCRWAARRLHARNALMVERAAERVTQLWGIVAVTLSVVVDSAVVLIAWVAGYALSVLKFGSTGGADNFQSLFLNGFLAVEGFKIIMRMFISARQPGLRLIPMADADAAYWNIRLALIVGFVGYGLLVIAPILAELLDPAFGQFATVVVVLIGFISFTILALVNRRTVRRKLRSSAQHNNSRIARLGLNLLARCWHFLAITYFAILSVVTITQPKDGLTFMGLASLKTLAIIGGGALLSRIVTQLIGRRINLPGSLHERFPAFESRLSRFIPRVLQVVRVLIVIVVVGLLFEVWEIAQIRSMVGTDLGQTIIGSAVSIGLVVALASLLWIIFASYVEERLSLDGNSAKQIGARERTLLTIFRNAFAILIVAVTAMIVLSELGLNIGPLIASAGVLGLAIGFGAQKLVQDVITGIFIQLEGAINTGDIVTAAGITGEAERLTIRSLGLRDLSGTYHLIPFSAVDTVSNFMRGFAYHLGVYGVAYREDTDEVIEHLQHCFAELRGNEEFGNQILEDLEVHGLTEFADSSVNVRVRIKTLPGSQWAVGREYNRLVKKRFDEVGIEIPFPHTTIYFGQDKNGEAPAMPLRLTRDDPQDQDNRGKSTSTDSATTGDPEVGEHTRNPQSDGPADPN